MARILYYTTHGTEDPTRAGLAFIGANGATQAGHDPVIALLGDATLLMRGDIPSQVNSSGLPSAERAPGHGDKQRYPDTCLRWLSPRPRGNRPGFGR